MRNIYPAALIILAVFLMPLGGAFGATPLTLAEARHLLQRTGFGAAPAEVAALIGQSRDQAVDGILAGLDREPVVPIPDWVQRWRYPYNEIEALGHTAANAFGQLRWAEMEEFRAWWLAEMIATPTPLRERMVLFWHNHFVTEFDKSECSQCLADQNRTLRRLATGNFRDLAAAMIRDPALIHYLDNQTSTAEAPNENLAREWFELFTLGEGRGYTEADVKAAARALTGHSIAEQGNLDFRFEAGVHDAGVKRIFGRSGRFGGDDLVTLALDNPEFGPFIVEKLWRTFVSDRPDPAEVARLAALWRAQEFEMVPLLRAIFLSDAFWAPENRGRLVKSPVELVVGTIRTLGLAVDDLAYLPQAIRRMGQDLFNAPNVAGWDGGTAWLSDTTALARIETLNRLLTWRPGAMPAGPSIAVRVAAEDFDGPTPFRVRINGRDAGIYRVPFGRDSLALGPVQDPDEDLTFATVHVTLPDPKSPVSQVEVRFEQDRYREFADGRTGDRNLYVRWVEVAGRRLPANLARARGECIDPHWQIGLWCEGRLTFEVAARAEEATNRGAAYGTQAGWPAAAGPDDLRVGLTAFLGAAGWRDEGGHGLWSEFLLFDVGFGGRTWRNIVIAPASWRSDEGESGTVIGFRRAACHPACFHRWPVAANGDDVSQTEFNLSVDNARVLRTMSPADRALIRALIAHLPRIVAATGDQAAWRQAVERPASRAAIAGIARDLAQGFGRQQGRPEGKFVAAVSDPDVLGVPLAVMAAVSDQAAEPMMVRMQGQRGQAMTEALAARHRSLADDRAWFARLLGGARDSDTVEALLLAVPVGPQGRRVERIVGDPAALIRRLVLDPRYQLK